MPDRASRLSTLKGAVNDYYKKETKRIENEVKILKAVLAGRTGGAGVQTSGVQRVEAVASNDLSSYLKKG